MNSGQVGLCTCLTLITFSPDVGASEGHLLFHVNVGFISLAWPRWEGSCDGFWLKIGLCMCSVSIISFYCLYLLSSFSFHSRQLLSAFDSLSAFCFGRSSISAFSISVVSIAIVSRLSLSHLLFYSVLILVVFVSSVYHLTFSPRLADATSL